MAKYHVELSGSFSLDKQSKAIEGEEALGSKFLTARIWVNSKNLITNLLEFEELDLAPDPPFGTPRLTEQLPAGTSPVWAGSWISGGTAKTQVFLIRV